MGSFPLDFTTSFRPTESDCIPYARDLGIFLPIHLHKVFHKNGSNAKEIATIGSCSGFDRRQ